MSSTNSGGAPSPSARTARECRKRELEERQKTFELKKRKRRMKLQLEDLADALALETESLQFQEEDLSQHQQDCALKQQKLADNIHAVAHMQQKLNAERKKLAELQRNLDAQNERLQLEVRQFSAEKEAVGSLEQDVAPKREKLAADQKELALAQKRFEDGDYLLAVDSSDSESSCSKRRKKHNLPAENPNESMHHLPRTPSSKYFRPIHSSASAGVGVHKHVFVRDGHGYFLGSPSGEAISAVLSEIRTKRGEEKGETFESIPSEHNINSVFAKVVKDHRLAILEKAKKVNKPVEDTGRIKYKASEIPADPRTAIPDKMKKSARVNSFNGLPLVREIDQYVGDVDWFAEERNLSALLAYMTGEIREPCTNCKNAADSGNQHWSQFLLCVTSDKLIGGECCHCHFRSAHGPLCSHRSGDSKSPKKRSSPSTPSTIPREVTTGCQCAPKEVTKEEATSIGGSPLERKAKADARSGIRRASAWSLFNEEEDEAEQSGLIF